MKDKSRSTVEEYLIDSLARTGLRHVFGIQGDYVLGFYSRLCGSGLEVINTCDEQGAGFAADAYARVSGFGAVCVTYGVGGLKLANTTAQAFAERSPVLVISGAPGMAERRDDPLLHHKIRSFDTQLNVFREMTVAQAVIDDAATAADRIDGVIGAIGKTKRPGYIELPRDMVDMETQPTGSPDPEPPPPNRAILDEAISEVLDMLASSEKPVVIAGLEVHRYGLQPLLLDFLERSGIPFVTGVLSKSIFSEMHPQFMGVYAGGMSPDDVREAVEEADCVISVGPLITDLSTGMFTHKVDTGRSVVIAPEYIAVRNHFYPGTGMEHFLGALTETLPEREGKVGQPRAHAPETFLPQEGTKVTVDRLFACVDAFLDDDTTVIAEPGDALFGALDLRVHGMTEFLSPAYYASLGFSVPASIGVQLATPHRRPLVLTGDGSFQMTGMELSVSAQLGLNPIVVILNNGGYGTFRNIADGPFNDIPPWRYADVVKVIGRGEGYTVATEDELERAFLAARGNDYSPTVIDVRLEKRDFSARMRRLARELKKRVK
ncbi:MAG: thiamine pyrophosphate-binding protein [Actinomycetota bacterium]|nr:thiamine pyrophosphate-binding protein [Actinomycetota bacterium]